MATTQSTSTSVFGYAEHVDWGKLYLKGNLPWYKVMAFVLIGYMALLLLGAVANVLGFRGINWVTGFVVQMVVLVFIGNPAHFIAVGGAGFLAGQPGGEPGPSAKEGGAKAWEWMAGFGRFVLYLGGVFAPLAFYAIGLWPIKSAPFLAFVLLAASVGLAVTSALIFEKAKFFVSLLWLVYLAIVVGILAYFTAPHQVQRKLDWMEARWSVNPADRARDNAAAKIRQARIDAVKKCYDDLKPDASQADKDRCEALYKAIDESLVPTILVEQTTAAGQVNGENQSTAPRTAEKPVVERIVEKAASLLPAPEPTWVCDALWKEVDYTPRWQGNEREGKIALGTLPAGRYEVTVSGKRWQPFFTGTPAVMDQTCEMNPDGNIGVCTDPQGKVIRNNNGEPWFPDRKPFGTTDVLIPENQYQRVPYGMFVLHIGKSPLPIGSKGMIDISNDLPVALDVNNFQGQLNYQGQGAFRVQIKQCTTV